jgi:glycosyltransferase involved in cell wall biosynthesis
VLERANVAGAACLHALTTAEASQYRNFGAAGPIAVVPNAVALPDDANPELFFTQFPELRGKRLLVFLSRLHPKKGLDLLLAAWQQTSRQHPDAHLVIAGPDSEGMQARLMAQAAAAGITGSLTFTGMLAGAMKWSALAAAEAYVLPSYSEGLSMALLEAMGMGLPVIATRACNMPEITAADAGWEVDATAEALASAVGDLWNRSTGENRNKGRRGAQLIAARYSPAQVARQMAEVYAFVLGGPVPDSVVAQKGRSR